MSKVNHRLPNRVHADGRLVSTTARGTMMGNRGGQFHDQATQQIRKRVPWATKQWICCVLDFKGRHRTVWTEGYTELFFLDEVTALSAGHRPCFECRRTDAISFQRSLFEAFGDQQGWEEPPKVAVVDALLHKARIEDELRLCRVDELPPGTLFKVGQDVFAKLPRGFARWTFEGYRQVQDGQVGKQVHVLTPAPIVATLAHGYQPIWHPSAGMQHNAKL